MQKLFIDDMYMWSVWQPDRNLFFNSFFIRRPTGNVVVDPLFWHPDDEQQMAALGGVALIIVTNRDHQRHSRELAQEFGAKIAASEKDAPLLSGPVDQLLHDGDHPFDGADVIALDGLKSPGEIAISLRGSRAAIVGDALWGDPAGAVRLLPDEKLMNPGAAVLSLRRLWGLRLQTLLVGDGACIFGDADRTIGDYLQLRADVYVNRVNVDEVKSVPFPPVGDYAASAREIGNLIGARRLGYWVVDVPSGKKFCPLHSHQLEEEMFFVLDGGPTIRTPRGEFACRKGDIICFPTGDAGTHQLINKSNQPCTLLMLGNSEPEEVAYYPDSKKVLARGRGLRVRAEPVLDYYDGEL